MLYQQKAPPNLAGLFILREVFDDSLPILTRIFLCNE
jgi:hypothetical protein